MSTNISGLITKLTDYLNLGKAVALTAPGVVMAIALMVLGWSWGIGLPELFWHTRVRPIQTTAPAGQTARLTWRQQDSMQIDTLVVEIGLARAEKAEADATVTMLEDQISDRRAQIEATLTLLNSREETNSPLAASSRSRLQTLEAQVSTIRTQDLPEPKRMVDSLTTRLTQLEVDLAARRSAWTTRLQGIGMQRTIGELIEAFILLGLLGFAIGALMTPITRSIFFDWIPKIPLFSSLKPNWVKAVPAQQKAITATDLEDIDKTGAAYYVGLKTISEEERDYYIANYYRYAEFGIGFVPAMLALTFSSMLFISRYELGLGWLAAILGILLAGVALVQAFYSYFAYKRKLAVFIAARLDKQERAREAAKRASEQKKKLELKLRGKAKELECDTIRVTILLSDEARNAIRAPDVGKLLERACEVAHKVPGSTAQAVNDVIDKYLEALKAVQSTAKKEEDPQTVLGRELQSFWTSCEKLKEDANTLKGFYNKKIAQQAVGDDNEKTT